MNMLIMVNCFRINLNCPHCSNRNCSPVTMVPIRANLEKFALKYKTGSNWFKQLFNKIEPVKMLIINICFFKCLVNKRLIV